MGFPSSVAPATRTLRFRGFGVGVRADEGGRAWHTVESSARVFWLRYKLLPKGGKEACTLGVQGFERLGLIDCLLANFPPVFGSNI